MVGQQIDCENQEINCQLKILKALAGICLLHLTTIFFLFWATIDDAWWFTRTLYTDLWGRWVMENNDDVWVYMDIPTSYRKGKRFTISGVVQLISCFCIMVALSVYTDHFHRGEKDGWYGWSYIMAWFGWLLTLFTGIMYIILRKRVD
ncbi:epithelial membrane protein 2-like isoform X3 [Myxocyprinus asiaticus]|uniref:epithelial membrane protein 2-like isoform X3 n=1 Tax=Myxocyprinus asiaticus TaxID=70543 RepID=UPI002221C982|nr:epithelial membrane protein 2-like isoform X3 [Myxocyprinus asiaticus]